MITCPVTDLAPGASTVCVGTYSITQADVDAGEVVNAATAVAISAAVGPVLSTDIHVVSIASVPSVSLDKRIASTLDQNANGQRDAGDQIGYQFLITNTGNVTLSGIIVIDPLTPVMCPGGSLPPGASTTCSALSRSLRRMRTPAR